jgi:hypothetical protein
MEVHMTTKTISMPEDVVINLLKTLPEEDIIDIFWKTLIESDVSPLTVEEREEIRKAKKEFKKGETLKWENIR